MNVNLGKCQTRYVSRANPRETSRHVILSTQTVRPVDFAGQLNVSLSNGWGIVRTIADLCLAQPDGKYLLVKDPNKVHTFGELAVGKNKAHANWSSRLFAYTPCQRTCSRVKVMTRFMNKRHQKAMRLKSEEFRRFENRQTDGISATPYVLYNDAGPVKQENGRETR